MKSLLLRAAARPYLAIYDLAMRLGPKWGPIALGYGPVVVGILAFVFKDRLLDPFMDPDTATVVIFLAFALCGPLMHVGTRIVTERLFRARNGQWPASPDPRFDRFGAVSPTVQWVEVVREWSRGAT
jgi:hypothetical protein